MNNNNSNNKRRRPRFRRAVPRKTQINQRPPSIMNQLWNMPTRDQPGVISGPFPNCMNVKCKTAYWQNVVSATAPFVLVEFRLNDVFLPYIASPVSASGLAAASGIYESYKVRSVEFDIEVIGNEAFGMNFGMFLRDGQPSLLINTYDQAIAAIANGPVCCVGTVGQTSGNSRTRTRPAKIDISRIVGDPMMYISDRDFASLVNTSPNQIVWGAFILVSDEVGTNLTNGLFAKITMAQNTCFFSKTINL